MIVPLMGGGGTIILATAGRFEVDLGLSYY